MNIFLNGFIYTSYKEDKSRTRKAFFSFRDKYAVPEPHRFVDGQEVREGIDYTLQAKPIIQ